MPDTSSPIVFETVGLTRDYSVRRSGLLNSLKRRKENDTLRAVDSVDLRVRNGDFMAIVGASGSGKSTLAKMLLGLLPPTSGTVLLDGRDVSAMPRKVFGARVQPVFQDPYSSLNPRRTIGDIVAQPLRLHEGGDRSEVNDKAVEMLENVGLSSRYFNAYPSQLSGGQRQRVSIARALICNPKVLVCDEPTSALDVSVQAQILNLLQDLREAYGLTFVFITHNLAIVRHMATNVAVMNKGRVVENRPAEDLFHAPADEYTRNLLAAAPRLKASASP